jgi:hypothetical protein
LIRHAHRTDAVLGRRDDTPDVNHPAGDDDVEN